MSTALKVDTDKPSHVNPKTVPKSNKTASLESRTQRPLKNSETVPLKAKQEINGQVKRTSQKTLKQAVITETVSNGKTGKTERKLPSKSITSVGSDNKKESKTQSQPKRIETKGDKTTVNKDVTLVRSPKLPRKKSKSPESENVENVNNKASSVKNDTSKGLPQRQTVKSATAVAPVKNVRTKNDISQKTSSQPRSQRSRSSTPAPVTLTSTSSTSSSATTNKCVPGDKPTQSTAKTTQLNAQNTSTSDSKRKTKGVVSTSKVKRADNASNTKYTDARTSQSRSRSNTPGSSFSSESATSIKTDKSSSSTSSKHSVSKTVSNSKKPLSAESTKVKSATSSTSDRTRRQTPSFMKTTQSSANRTSNGKSNEISSRKQTNTTETASKSTATTRPPSRTARQSPASTKPHSDNVRKSPATTRPPSRSARQSTATSSPLSGNARQSSGTTRPRSEKARQSPAIPSDKSHSATSGSSHESSPDTETSPLNTAKSASGVDPVQSRPPSRAKSKLTDNSTKTKTIQLTKKTIAKTKPGTVHSSKTVSEITNNKTATCRQLVRKSSPDEAKPPLKTTTTTTTTTKTSVNKKTSSSTNDKTVLKSKPTRANDTSTNESQTVCSGKRTVTNRSESKTLMADKRPAPVLVNAICLQDDDTDRSKRSTSNEPVPKQRSRSTTPYSHLSKSATTDKCSSGTNTRTKSTASGIKSKEQRQLKPGSGGPAKPERKSTLIAPLSKNASNRLSKVSKRDLDVSSGVGRNVSKLKSLKSTEISKSTESVSGVKVSKGKSETKGNSAKINKSDISTKTSVRSEKRTKTVADSNKCTSTSRTERKQDIKSNYSDMSIISAENNEASEKPNFGDTSSLDPQTCDLCSETGTFSDSRDLCETEKHCACSPISQNYMEANNQCKLSEKMEFSEISSTDIVYITQGSNNERNNSENVSDNWDRSVTMETGSADSLRCSEMQMHQHVHRDRCNVMDVVVSEQCPDARPHVPASDQDIGLDCIDGYCYEEPVRKYRDCVDKISVNMDYTGNLCDSEVSEQGDNSCETLLNEEQSDRSVISLSCEMLCSEGKIPYGENLSPVCKSDAFYQTSEILSSTDSGFFTNENSGQTSFISSTTRLGDDEGVTITHDPNDSYDGYHNQATYCDGVQNNQSVERDNLLSDPSTSSQDPGIKDYASSDTIMQPGLQNSNLIEISPESQTDKQGEIANILMNGEQDLNPNFLRNMPNETGWGVPLADVRDKDPGSQDSYPGGVDNHSYRQTQSDCAQIQNINKPVICEDGHIDKNNKTAASGHELLSMESQVATDQSLPECNYCSDSSCYSENLKQSGLGDMDSGDFQNTCKTITWQDKELCDTENKIRSETSELSVLPESCTDLNTRPRDSCEDIACTEPHGDYVAPVDPDCTRQSSVCQFDENSNKTTTLTPDEGDENSCFKTDTVGLNHCLETNSTYNDIQTKRNLGTTESTNSSCYNSITDVCEIENDRNKCDVVKRRCKRESTSATRMSYNECNRLSLQEEINNALLLSQEINNTEEIYSDDNVLITNEQRLCEQSEMSTFSQNNRCYDTNTLLDVNELDSVQVLSEDEDPCCVNTAATGESTPRRSSLTDHTCTQTDDTRSLSTVCLEPPEHFHMQQLQSQNENSEILDKHLKCTPESEILTSSETEYIENFKSANLLANGEIKGDSNCSQLAEILTASEQRNLSETPLLLAHGSATCSSQEIIRDIGSPGTSPASQCNMKRIPTMTSHDPDSHIPLEYAISDEQQLLNDSTDFKTNIRTPETINANYAEADKPAGSEFYLQNDTRGNSGPNFQPVPGCNTASTHAQNEYNFNTAMEDREQPLNPAENTLHGRISQRDGGDQIKNDSTSINMNENLKGSKINDLSSYVDTTESSPVCPSRESAREIQGSRDIYLNQTDNSTGSQVIEINNHIPNQDFLEDQMSGLSVKAHTTQKSSCNLQVYSGGFSEPQEFMLKDEPSQSCIGYERQLTPCDDLGTCTKSPKPCNKSRLCNCTHDDGIKSEFHINSGNYDRSEGLLWRAGEECCTICLESIDSLQLQQLNDDCGFTQGAEIIKNCANKPLLQQHVNIFAEDKCDFEQTQISECQELSHTGGKNRSSEISTGCVLPDSELTGANGEPCKTGGLDYDNILSQSEDGDVLIDKSIKTENNGLPTDSSLFDVSKDVPTDNTENISDCLTQNHSFESTEGTDKCLSRSTQTVLQSQYSSQSSDQGLSPEFEDLCSSVIYQDGQLGNNTDQIRKTSIEIEGPCTGSTPILTSKRGEQIKVLRDDAFESETESGDSGSTGSGSSATEVGYDPHFIVATAGEALCESLSPTEVAGILDDTSDSYVDATDSPEYETDSSEIVILSAPLHLKDNRLSGEYSVCGSTSTESFQDAVEALEDGRHFVLRSPDVTLQNSIIEDEDSLSQISLPLSDCSTGSSTSLENLTVLGELSDSSCREETDNEGMEPSGKPRVATFRSSQTVTRSSLRHVQTSDYRTKSVLKDNLYRGVANGSQHTDRRPQVGTNVLRSTDTSYESGNQVIKNVIYKTGNRIFHSQKLTQHQTGANFTTGALPKNALRAERETAGQGADRTDRVDPECASSDGAGLDSDATGDGDKSDTSSQSNLDTDQLCDSSESSESLILSVSPTPGQADNMSVSDGVKPPVDVNIGLKIETAMSIRTERRRLRRRQVKKQVTDTSSSTVTVSTVSTETVVKSDTQCAAPMCAEGVVRDNAVIYDSPEITLENSSRITNESCTVSLVDEPSRCRDETRDMTECKQKAGHSICEANISTESKMPEARERTPLVPPVVYELKDPCLEKPNFVEQIIVSEQGVIQKGTVDSNARNADVQDDAISTEVVSSVTDDNIVTEDASSSYVSSVKDDNAVTEDASSSPESLQNDQISTLESAEKTYTFYIQSGTDNDFDDIQFIDEEENGNGHTSSNGTRVKPVDHIEISKDQRPEGPIVPSPNASFTIEYSVEGDTSTEHVENSDVNKPQSASDSSHPTDVHAIDTDLSLIQSRHDTECENDSSIIENTKKEVASIKTFSDSKVERSDCEISLQIKSGDTCTDSQTTTMTTIKHEDADECNSEIVEESHISVKDALRMEKDHLNHDTDTLRRSSSRHNVKRTLPDVPSNTLRKSKSDDISKLGNANTLPIKKSLSFRNERKFKEETDDQLETSQKVTNICRSFIKNLRPVSKPSTDRDSGHAGRQRKLMKWVRDNGKWLRIPVSEAEEREIATDGGKLDYEQFAAELNTPSEANTPTEPKYFAPLETVQADQPDKSDDDKSLSKDEEVNEKDHISTNVTSVSPDASSQNVTITDETPEREPEPTVITESVQHSEQNVITISVEDVQDAQHMDSKSTCDVDQHICTVDQSEDNTGLQNDVPETSNISKTAEIVERRIDISETAQPKHVEPEVPNDSTAFENKTELQKEIKVDNKEESSITCANDVGHELQKTSTSKPTCSTPDANDTDTKTTDASVHIDDDVRALTEATDDTSETRFQRQELLFGIRDSYSRKKHKKLRPESKTAKSITKLNGDGLMNNERSEDTVCDNNENTIHVSETINDTSTTPIELPKAIPKLKAVKIQEEVFEGNPEYMKECNKEPSWSEFDSNVDNVKQQKDQSAVQRSETRLRQSVHLRKSKTFSGIGDFEHNKRELYMTIEATEPSVTVSQESLDIPKSPIQNKGNLVKVVVSPDDFKSDSKTEYTVKDQGSSKIPWYANKSRRSRDKEKVAVKDTKVAEDSNTVTGDNTRVARDSSRVAGDITVTVTKTTEKKRLKLPVFSRAKSLQRRKLLSEIVEVEENKDDNNPQISNNSSSSSSRHSARHSPRRESHHPGQQRSSQLPQRGGSKQRSLSLPTGTLAFGEARIVYKNGHFTIETMDGTEIDSTRPLDPEILDQQALNSTMLVTSDSREVTLPEEESSSRDTTLSHKPHMKRQCAKSYLNRSDSSEDVFYNEDEEIENISPNSLVAARRPLRAGKMGQLSRTSLRGESDPDSSQYSETSLECSASDRMDMDTDSDRSLLSERSSSSLQNMSATEEVVREAQRAKRTSSFRRAQERGALHIAEITENIESEQPKSEDSNSKQRTESVGEDDLIQHQQSSTFLQKMMAKRKSMNDTSGLSNFSKQSESAKDFFAKKMTLKGLFKKNKSDSSVGSPLKLQQPVSPPIAAFQGDDDIGSIDTPPGSPAVQHDLRRRHTSADIYIRSFAGAGQYESAVSVASATSASETADSNCPTPTQDRSTTIIRHPSLSSPSTPSHESNSLSSGVASSREEDQISITSGSSATSSVYSSQMSPLPLEQPNKPKTPKPVGASPRRNPSYSSYLGRAGSVSSQRDAYNSVTSLEGEHMEGDEIAQECRCDCERKASTLPRHRKLSDVGDRKGSSDSLTSCPYCKQLSNYTEVSGGSTLRKLRKRSTSSTRHGSVADTSAVFRKDSSSRTSAETLGILSQADVVSSNSNDSGILRDVGVNSSNESIKGISDGPVQLRRRKSSSPQPERPKSEVGVRWADLDAQDDDDDDDGVTTGTPVVKLRQRDQNIKDRPRPKSDFEENIQLFDELFEEVLEDFVTEGSSFLSDRMSAFGSEMNLQPYCSLRNLYEMRRRELDKQKNRRMSTPHPIKSRLQRVPRKLQKQPAPTLVRSSSMPESLEKIHKRRKLHDLISCPNSQYFPLDSLGRHMCPCASDDSDLSLDNISLQGGKSVSVQSSQSQLTSMEEDEDNLTFAEALWDHITMDPEELGFRAQDVIEVVDMQDKDWWFGAIDDREGWFPAAFVRLRVNQDQLEDDLDVTLQEELTTSPKLRRISMFNKNQARTNVVNEIINAEREYVKHLKDVVEGYIQHARKRKEMFSDERILLIFGNIEDIYKFACKFLAQLDMCIDVCPHLSEIGQCFLDNDKGFEIYSDYCNNHPSACEELKELCIDSKYKHFFEACRLLQDLVEIPLEGFLLTPVQKICKYPLQLAELLKYTPPDHPDYEKVRDALAAMRKIATLINERKRKMESIEKIAVWQHSVVDWEGSDLLERSSELIFSGDVNKINTAGWSQERYFFLFDHQLIYCKKELLKRHVFSYKGRIDLDHCEITDVLDGKDMQYNVSVKHAWKLHETHRDKWYLLYAKSAAVKDRWLKALKDERNRVKEDQENDFCMPDHWKQTVLNKVRSQSSLKDKQQSGRGPHLPTLSHHKDYKDFTYSTLPRRLHGNKQDNKKKGWFGGAIFGGGKKSKR